MFEISLPRDDGFHHCEFEWWYLNGHLVSSGGRQFGFAWVLFKLAKPGGGRDLSHYDFQSHFSLIDEQSKKCLNEIRKFSYSPFFSRLLAEKLDIRFKGVRLRQAPGDQYGLALQGQNYSLNFQLSSIAPVMFHGERGFLSMAESGSSLYYSRPRLQGKGHWTVNRQPWEGSADVWMDHQWGSWTPNTVYWSWYAISLDNAIHIMVFKLSKRNANAKCYVTIQYPDGVQERIDDIKIETQKIWRSPKTQIEYPVDVILKIGVRENISLRVAAISPDQEIDSDLAKYWEGACLVEGQVGKDIVRGKAYAEIIGAYLNGGHQA